MTNYLDLSVTEINTLLKDGKVTPLDLTNEAIEKIEKSDLNAFITLDKEGAIKQAKVLANKPVDNLLFGIPIAIKDNIVTKGLLTTAGSKMLDNFIPPYDATVVNKVKAANMIIIGKSNLDEFSYGAAGETSYFGKTYHPRDRNLFLGGSSSGSGAAVAGGLVPLAIGTDTGGSIRIPASATGIVGLKPTYGLVSRWGVIPLASSMDTIGPMTNDVTSNACLLNAIAGIDEHDLTSVESTSNYTALIGKDIKGRRVAIPNFFINEEIEEANKEAIKEIANLLEQNGVTIDYIDVPYIEHARLIYTILLNVEAASGLMRYDGIKYGHVASNYDDLESLYANTRGEGFGKDAKLAILLGTYLLNNPGGKNYYFKAMSLRKLLTEHLVAVFNDYDFILGPILKRSSHANLAGLPALSMPVKENGTSIQIISNYHDEAKIYQLASFIEREVNNE